jgi:DNA-binding PadR family transcriptional regulator
MGLFKHSYILLLLLNLLQEDPEGMYGYQISQVVKARSKGQYQLTAGTLYPLLHQLEKRGMLKGRWRQESVRRGRKYYLLTTKGEQLLVDENARLREFVKLIQGNGVVWGSKKK